MSFTQQFEASYRWRSAGAQSGLEHLHVNSCENNIIITSVVIGERGGVSYGVNYSVICSPDWAVRSFKIENTKGNSLSMNSDGEGAWFFENGSAASEFSGALEIDLSGTPFTNTLAIRRMGEHKAGRSQRFKMLYVAFDTLEPKLDKQQYTCLVPFKKYRYEALGRDVGVELMVDENGVVGDYNDLFTRENLEK